MSNKPRRPIDFGGSQKTGHSLARRGPDTRIVNGLCTWWGSIYDAGHDGTLPQCPFCGSPLFECDDEDEWWAGIKPYASESEEFTREFVEWCRHPTSCSRTRDEALARFRVQKLEEDVKRMEREEEERG